MLPLLTLEQQALVRAWIRGIPLSSLDLDEEYDILAQLTTSRTKLYLKATRLQLSCANTWLNRSPEPEWEAAALRHLSDLLRQPDIEPQKHQSLRFWLAQEQIASLEQANLFTVSDVIQLYQKQGGSWWKDIGGIGRIGARHIESAINQLFPGVLAKRTVQDGQVFLAGIVPLERIKLPSSLNGSQGINRAEMPALIPIFNDLTAIKFWLSSYSEDSHTYRSYKRGAERLVLWSITLKRKPISSLNAADMEEFILFLQNPQPRNDWVGPPQPQNHPNWKPFAVSLSQRSVKQTEALLNSLFNFLVRQRYLRCNPLSDVLSKKTPDASTRTLRDKFVIDVHRSFSSDQWLYVCETSDRLVMENAGRDQRKWIRNRLILHVGYSTGLLLHELAQLTICDLIKIDTPDHTQYWLDIHGARHKSRQVPLPPDLVNLLFQSYKELTGAALMIQRKNYPLFPDLNNSSKSITPMAIHKIMKDFFKIVSNRLMLNDPPGASHLAKASAHWLRHTHGTIAVANNIPLSMIRDNLGHSSVVTTTLYRNSDADDRYLAFMQLSDKKLATGEN